MRKHLAIMDLSTIESILSGKKTIETRFSKHKISPFGQVGIGDLVYLKPPGKEIAGQFRVKKVFSFEGLTKEDMDKISVDFGSQIGSVLQKDDVKFGTLIFISESERLIASPIKFQKKDQRGWVVLA